MLVLVALETAVLVLLVVLVAGLLRSHADVLRALHSLGARVGDPEVPADVSAGTAGADPAASHARSPARLSGPSGRRAPDLVGVTPDGEVVAVAPGGTPLVVAFLSTGCRTCAGFWEALAGGGAGALAPSRVVVVTRSPEQESESALAGLAPQPGSDGPPAGSHGRAGAVTVVMSSAAWDDYVVPGSPYFVQVDAGGRVTGEGTAVHWDQLVSLCRQAWADADDREGRADRELLAAGIHPGHPSLYPDPAPPPLPADHVAGRPGGGVTV